MEKENQMISVHGNKSSLALAGICMITLLLMFAGLISERKTKVRFYEKKYESALSSLEKNNSQYAGLDEEIRFSEK